MDFNLIGRFALKKPLGESPARVCSSCEGPVAPGRGGMLGMVMDVTCSDCVSQGPVGQRKATRLAARKGGRVRK